MPIKFTPLVTFHDDDLQSEYLVGFTYTVRPGNDRLAGKLAEWRKAGLVKEDVAPGDPVNVVRAKVRGTGYVRGDTYPLTPIDGNK